MSVGRLLELQYRAPSLLKHTAGAAAARNNLAIFQSSPGSTQQHQSSPSKTTKPATKQTILTAGVIGPLSGAKNDEPSQFTPSSPPVAAPAPTQPVAAQSAIAESTAPASAPQSTVTQPVIVYVTQGSPTPYSTTALNSGASIEPLAESPSPDPKSTPASSAQVFTDNTSQPAETPSAEITTIHATSTTSVFVTVSRTVYDTPSSSSSSSSPPPPPPAGTTSSPAPAPKTTAGPEVEVSADADDTGLLSVVPVTPSGFITITETTTVTERVTETDTVTSTVTRG
ncbi:hypothetical protein NUU61_009031 [Penicillium alfredii]|uniref:Uncharacterized protein n=1 Tax=Penicillium alfredii TaxID=1506179 RepID=A0A9W9JXA0_9EURO|nr:uncharacterized protein NUU61_009031 [Penicillium alfredii]KAJ5084452.1 hypothetical protein NUU61_009031 [Penicillium alfredii]